MLRDEALGAYHVPVPRRRADSPFAAEWTRARQARRARHRRRLAGCLGALVVANLGVQMPGVLGAAPLEPPPKLLRAVALPAPDVAPPAPAPDPVPEPPTTPVVDTSVIGHIEIPRLGLDVPLHQGIEMTFINKGPSHWPGTAMPGETGNVVVAGHRVTKTKPFRHIDTLVVGDEVIFTVDGARWVYRVTEHEVVDDQAMWITEQTAEPTATLFACHPPGSAKYRWVTRLALDQDASQPAPGAVTAPA